MIVSVHVQPTSQFQVIQIPIANIYKLQNRSFISSLDTRVDTLFWSFILFWYDVTEPQLPNQFPYMYIPLCN